MSNSFQEHLLLFQEFLHHLTVSRTLGSHCSYCSYSIVGFTALRFLQRGISRLFPLSNCSFLALLLNMQRVNFLKLTFFKCFDNFRPMSKLSFFSKVGTQLLDFVCQHVLFQSFLFWFLRHWAALKLPSLKPKITSHYLQTEERVVFKWFQASVKPLTVAFNWSYRVLERCTTGHHLRPVESSLV